MHPKLESYILSTVSKVAGVTVHLKGRDSAVYHAVVVQKQKGELHITDRKQNLASIDELKSFLPKGCPLVINIEGWGVLVKKASFDEEGHVVSQLVSNPEEFEMFSYMGSQGQGLVAIIRQELFREVQETFQNLSNDILQIEAGPLGVDVLVPILGMDDWQITGQYKVLFESSEIKEVKAIGKEESINYKMGDDILSSANLPAFAMSVKALSGLLEAGNSQNDLLLEEYSFKKLIEFTGIGVLGLLFIGLLINYFLFDHYNQRYNQISGEYSLNESLIQKLDQKRQELARAEDLMVKVGLKGQTRFAWYADRLASVMPSKLILTRLAFQAPDKKLRQGYEMELKENTISVEGETTQTLKVHEWVQNIKQEEWVKEVEITSFSQEEMQEPAVFSLELKF